MTANSETNITKKTLIAGNWKMNLNLKQSLALAAQMDQSGKNLKSSEVAIFPSVVALASIKPTLKNIELGIQNIYFADEGAFTGEVSAAQVADLVAYAILGHSERRHIFNETDDLVARKAAACVRSGITPIICVGETQHEREEKETTQVLNDQIMTSLTMLTSQDISSSVIAYEPVWAIGTGNNARPEDVTEAITTIRRAVKEMFGEKAAQKVRVLYGGSVKSDTAGSYLDLEEVDGLLVGGASINGHEFDAIIKRAENGKQ